MKNIMRFTDVNNRVFLEVKPAFFERMCLQRDPDSFSLKIKEFNVNGNNMVLEYYEINSGFQLVGGLGEANICCVAGDRVFRPF